jgi:hypothetical protein
VDSPLRELDRDWRLHGHRSHGDRDECDCKHDGHGALRDQPVHGELRDRWHARCNVDRHEIADHQSRWELHAGHCKCAGWLPFREEGYPFRSRGYKMLWWAAIRCTRWVVWTIRGRSWSSTGGSCRRKPVWPTFGESAGQMVSCVRVAAARRLGLRREACFVALGVSDRPRRSPERSSRGRGSLCGCGFRRCGS